MRLHRWLCTGVLIGASGLLLSTDAHGQRRGGGRMQHGGFEGGGRFREGGGYEAGIYGGGSTRNVQRPYGLSATEPSGSANSGKGSYTTKRGGTIDYAGAGGKGTGAEGGKGAGGVYGIDVTTAGGKDFEHAGHAGGVMGPGGYEAARRGGISQATGERGSATTGSRGGIASGPEGNTIGGRSRGGIASNGQETIAGGSRAGFASGEAGTIAGGERGGVARGPEGVAGGGRRWAAGEGANGAFAGGRRSAFAAGASGWGRYTSRWGAAGNGTHYVAGGSLRVQGAYVRGGFIHYNSFTAAWFTAHPTAWHPAAWTAAMYWTPASYAVIAPVIGLPAQPVTYDYGSTIVYEGDQVYDQGQPVATAQEYAQQAADLATQGRQVRTAEADNWIPLGVFGLVQGQETNANTVFQLAVNKDGVLRGNYYDALTEITLPVTGSVDKKTQRAAWTVGDRNDTVYETGVANLTRPETQVLIHFGKDKTQQWTLVRLEQPEEETMADKQK